MLRRILFASVFGIACAASVAAVPAIAQSAQMPGDPDHDGKLSLDEAKTSADQKFDALDTDHEGTLSAKELHGVVASSEFKAADPDHDGKIEKAEWETLVEKRFKTADTEHDGQVTPDELATPAGKKLAALLQ
jgi:hypothetical protein